MSEEIINFDGEQKVISSYAGMVNEDNLREIQSFDDVTALFENAVANVADVLGDGFTVVENKETLIGQEFVVVNHRFVKGDHGPYSIVHVVTRDGRKLLFLDGSTGVHAQFGELHTRGLLGKAALHVPRGLRKSVYETIVDGKTQNATTYYLDTSSKA